MEFYTHHNETRPKSQGAGLAHLGRVTKPGPSLLLAILCLVIFAAGHGNLKAGENRGPVALSSLGARPVFPLAEINPQPSREEIGKSAETALWWVGGVVLVMELIKFFRPQPPLHKEYANREETSKTIDKVLTEVKDLGGKFERYQTEQAGRRRVMYSRIAHLETKVAFMTAKLDDHDLSRMERALATHTEDHGE